MLIEDSYIPGNPPHAGSDNLIVLTGCSSSGKSTLITELARRGHAVRHEAGRQVVKEQLAVGGDGVPWGETDLCLHLIVSRSMYLYNTADPGSGPVFFDRSVLDALAYVRYSGDPMPAYLEEAARLYRYGPLVFITPPWEALFTTDEERRGTFAEAVAEYEQLPQTYEELGYDLVYVPQSSVSNRADFIETVLRERNVL